ncbi:hypothetical protein HMPREF9162_0451 [Selenomonas sp. oral taxon 137 str. F0430]|uniref:hypothetical protein n=1 Tax=unclassified Selenomonas TaxID=2637378 RepID=UPI0001EB31B3|nr:MULTISPECIES: hypothetical protein [unclassified Selenomonas]EFR39806.1 hypothetical protein HMPREF9162_0451 [Selenomonas sp. oral taxon 137 str. F0430]EJP28865.1 hypothetical protein HMPREF1147_1264 [Selenomonas sp. FOBRC9]
MSESEVYFMRALIAAVAILSGRAFIHVLYWHHKGEASTPLLFVMSSIFCAVMMGVIPYLVDLYSGIVLSFVHTDLGGKVFVFYVWMMNLIPCYGISVYTRYWRRVLIDGLLPRVDRKYFAFLWRLEILAWGVPLSMFALLYLLWLICTEQF